MNANPIIATDALSVYYGKHRGVQFRVVFPFYYYEASTELFGRGIEARNPVILLAIALVFALLAAASFQRRNITVGAWLWQRPRVGS